MEIGRSFRQVNVEKVGADNCTNDTEIRELLTERYLNPCWQWNCVEGRPNPNQNPEVHILLDVHH